MSSKRCGKSSYNVSEETSRVQPPLWVLFPLKSVQEDVDSFKIKSIVC